MCILSVQRVPNELDAFAVAVWTNNVRHLGFSLVFFGAVRHVRCGDDGGPKNAYRAAVAATAAVE